MARSAGAVGLLTLASRVLGLVRDAVAAAFFPKRATDAFFVAFTIPNVLRRLLAEGSLTVAFIPVFTEYRERHGEAPAREMAANTLGAALTVLLVVTALGIIFSPQLVWAFAYGLARTPARMALAVTLTRVMFFFLVTVGLTALAMGVLNTYRHFSGPAMAPVVLNITIIGSVFFTAALWPRWGYPPTMAMATGVLAGGCAQLLLQLPFLRRKKMLLLPRFHFTHPGVIRVGKLMAPSLFALAIYQINVILARQFASLLPEGSISAIYYAQRLIEFPIGIFAVALATVAMPELSSHATAGDLGRVRKTFNYALRIVFFIMAPATAGLLALGGPLTAMLFQRGHFDPAAAQQTSATLVGFICGLWAAGGVRQTVQVFYALQDTKTPVKVSGLALLVFGISAWSTYRGLGTFGLALSVSIGSSVNFLLLLFLLRRRLGPLGLFRVIVSALKAAISAAACGGAAWWVASFGAWSKAGAYWPNYLVLLTAVGAGVGVYVAMSYVLRAEEVSELAHAFRRRRARR